MRWSGPATTSEGEEKLLKRVELHRPRLGLEDECRCQIASLIPSAKARLPRARGSFIIKVLLSAASEDTAVSRNLELVMVHIKLP